MLSMYVQVVATYFSLDDPLFAIQCFDHPRVTPVTKIAAVANDRECGAKLVACPIACSWRRGPEMTTRRPTASSDSSRQTKKYHHFVKRPPVQTLAAWT